VHLVGFLFIVVIAVARNHEPEIFYIHRCGLPQIPHTKNVAHITHCIPYLRRLLAYRSPRTSSFYSKPDRVGFMVDRLTSGRVLLPALLFSSVTVIPPVLHSRSFVSHQLFIVLTNDRIVKQTLEIETIYSRWYKVLFTKMQNKVFQIFYWKFKILCMMFSM
jgi:hypothetical protein